MRIKEMEKLGEMTLADTPRARLTSAILTTKGVVGL
jgi:hypothetical protein